MCQGVSDTTQQACGDADAASDTNLALLEAPAGDAVVRVHPQVSPRHLLSLVLEGARLPVVLALGRARQDLHSTAG